MISCHWRYSMVAATLYCHCDMVEVLYGAYHSNKWNTYGLSLLWLCVSLKWYCKKHTNFRTGVRWHCSSDGPRWQHCTLFINVHRVGSSRRSECNSRWSPEDIMPLPICKFRDEDLFMGVSLSHRPISIGVRLGSKGCHRNSRTWIKCDVQYRMFGSIPW